MERNVEKRVVARLAAHELSEEEKQKVAAACARGTACTADVSDEEYDGIYDAGLA